MSSSKRSTGASGVLSIIASFVLIAFTFIPLLFTIYEISIWEVMIKAIENGGEYIWVPIVYFVWLTLLILNIILQFVGCCRTTTILSALLGTFFVVMFCIDIDNWGFVGVSFYVMAVHILLLFIASMLPGGKREKPEFSNNIIINTAENNNSAELNNTRQEVSELKEKLRRIERENEERELYELRAKVARLEEEKRMAAQQKQAPAQQNEQAAPIVAPVVTPVPEPVEAVCPSYEIEEEEQPTIIPEQNLIANNQEEPESNLVDDEDVELIG